MNQQELYKCNNDHHNEAAILGHCLNLGCKESRSQFCLNCFRDETKHKDCKENLTEFSQIKHLITKYKEKLDNQTTQLNKCFTQITSKFQECSKSIENIKSQLIKMSECITEQDYEYIRVNIQSIRKWYQYFNKQEQIIEQNQFGNQLTNIKRIINALNLDQQSYREIKLWEGIDLLNQKKWQQAHELFSEILKQVEKQKSFALFFQNISLHEINELSKGYQSRENAKKINKNLYKDLLEYSNLELERNSKNKFLLIARSYALNSVQQYQQAIEQCDEVLNEDSQNLHALYRKSVSLGESNENNQANEILNRVLCLNPNYGIALFQKGIVLNKLQKYQDAIKCYENAIKIDPNYATAYISKGDSLHNLQKYDDAIICYEQAIHLDPTNVKAWNNKGTTLSNLLRYKDAIDCYDKAILLDPNNGSAYINKGNSLLNCQQYENAIVCYNQAIQLDPNIGKAYYNKGMALEHLNKYEEALQNYSQCIQIDQKYSKAYMNKGGLLIKQKNYQQAIEIYEQAIKNCKVDQNEFKKLIERIKNKK